MRVEPTGKVTVLTGISPHGQAKRLRSPRSSATCSASRSTTCWSSTATLQSCNTASEPSAAAASRWAGTRCPSPRKMVAKARTLAAHLLGTNEASLTFENGRFVGAPDDRSVTIQEVALAAYVRNIPPDFEPGLVATHFFEPKNFTFPNGTHVCVVEVDKETGET